LRRLPFLLFLFSHFCFSQTGAHRIGQILVKGNNIAANVAPFAKISVCVAGTGCKTLANIFGDAALTSPLTQPLTADGSGNYDYYVASGCVDEQISSPGQSMIFTPNVCPFNGTSGGGSANITPAPQHKKTFFNLPGTVSNVGGDSVATTDGAGNETSVSQTGIPFAPSASIPSPPPNSVSYGPHIITATDYIPFSSTFQKQSSTASVASTITQNVNRRTSAGSAYGPAQLNLNMLSGQDNTNTVNGNYGLLALNANTLTPIQGGGMLGITANCLAVGDCVIHEATSVARGVSRGEDEGAEGWRFFLYGMTNSTAGGTLTSFTTDAQGAISATFFPFTGTNVNVSFYEKSFLADVTKKWQSPGNIASIGAATDNRWEFFQGDGTAGITTEFGVSSQTTLTQAIDSTVYNNGCPTTPVSPPAVYPTIGLGFQASGTVGDGFQTDYKGVGLPQQNANYNSAGLLKGTCITVASTAGSGGGLPLAAGDIVLIADSNYEIEYTTVIAVWDTTHFTAFIRQPHSLPATGSGLPNPTVNWGGAVGYGIGMDADIAPPGTNTYGANQQTVTQYLIYPIVQSFAGDRVNVYTNTEGSSPNNLRTVIPNSNTPVTPLVLSSPTVVGGVLTNVLSNTNNYQVSGPLGQSGHPHYLPTPTITTTGCTVAPTFNFTVTPNTNSYVAHVLNGGSGCVSPTFTVSPFLPTPFGIYPMTMVYRSEDWSQPAGVTGDGKITMMPFLTTANAPTGAPVIAAGDTITSPIWWNGGATSSQYSYIGDSLNMLNGRGGAINTINFKGISQNAAYDDYHNYEPTSHYYGSFANNYVNTNPMDYIAGPPEWSQLDGQYANAIFMGFPPLTISGGSTYIGGSIISVGCGRGSAASTVVDPPCLHGLDTQYNLFSSLPAPGGTGNSLSLFVNNKTGSMGLAGNSANITWQAPVMTAYNSNNITPDALIAGSPFGGINRGPCTRYDFLNSVTGAYNSSYGRICGVSLAGSGSAGSLQFEVNTGPTGAATYVTPFIINPTNVTSSVPISSTVATGTAPFPVTSTTMNTNFNAALLGGVALSGICQTSGAGCPAAATGFSGSFITTAVASESVPITGMSASGHCAFAPTNSSAAASTGSYISTKTTNAVTFNHAAVAGMSFDFICSAN
jgi:hypothetical protein